MLKLRHTILTLGHSNSLDPNILILVYIEIYLAGEPREDVGDFVVVQEFVVLGLRVFLRAGLRSRLLRGRRLVLSHCIPFLFWEFGFIIFLLPMNYYNWHCYPCGRLDSQAEKIEYNTYRLSIKHIKKGTPVLGALLASPIDNDKSSEASGTFLRVWVTVKTEGIGSNTEIVPQHEAIVTAIAFPGDCVVILAFFLDCLACAPAIDEVSVVAG